MRSDGREARDLMKWIRRGEEGWVEDTWHARSRNVSQRFQRKFSGSAVVGSGAVVASSVVSFV